MTGAHPPLGPELRHLAQSLLDRLDPAVRLAAAAALRGADGTSRCTQVWCPVCALAALVAGEQHPLLALVADHSVALLEVVRALVADTAAAPGDVRPPPSPDDIVSAPRGYQRIDIEVDAAVDTEVAPGVSRGWDAGTEDGVGGRDGED